MTHITEQEPFVPLFMKVALFLFAFMMTLLYLEHSTATKLCNKLPFNIESVSTINGGVHCLVNDEWITVRPNR